MKIKSQFGNEGQSKTGQLFENLVQIMQRLRKKCPWDRQQTPESIRPYLIEELYEVLEAQEKKDPQALKEELGDLLLQIIFHTTMAAERKDFSIEEVIQTISEKLIRRHPHVFGKIQVSDAEEVLKNWENIKIKESQNNQNSSKMQAVLPLRSLLDGVPRQMPALLRAWRLQQKASRVGFDWQDISGILEKVAEEMQELKAAIDQKDPEAMVSELGDLLFAVVNVSRFLPFGADDQSESMDIQSRPSTSNPEDALHQASDRFTKRFKFIEETAREKNLKLENMSLEEMDKIWEEAKEK